MAGEFDAFERRIWAGKAQAYKRAFASLCGYTAPELLDAAGVTNGTALLDVGTGPGTVAAAALARGAKVTAVDAEPSMVELAAATGAEVHHAVLPELPFMDGGFDAVVANFVVNHVEQPVDALAELRRVTRPGGRTAVTIWATSAPVNAMVLFGEALNAAGVARPEVPTVPVEYARTPEGLAGLLAQAGWDGVTAREVSWTHRVDPESWWSGAAEGTAAIGHIVATQPATTVARIKAEYDRLAERYLDADGLLALPAVAVLATALN